MHTLIDQSIQTSFIIDLNYINFVLNKSTEIQTMQRQFHILIYLSCLLLCGSLATNTSQSLDELESFPIGMFTEFIEKLEEKGIDLDDILIDGIEREV